ncbi:MAG: hypothetical protein JNL89_16150 [Rhodanobacteraceae bacterium]|jgi:hypothetical protein|nr:hypothetical protein [Rhodanobacteraceae bacterium]
MTSKTSKTATKAPAKASAKPKDLKPKKDAKGGLPAVQKVREAGARSG